MELVENIYQYCSSRGITAKEFERQTGLFNGAVWRWRDGVQSPTLTSMQKIADATGIPLDCWMKKGGVDGR